MADRKPTRKMTDRSEAQKANRARPVKTPDEFTRDKAVVHQGEKTAGNEPHRQIGGSQTQRDDG
ncbi:hypothetical protein [Rhodospirillaceae bacterium SYSU D60014]|uniref:hypothetical protein n=1 Tax=Virgifigura deserti TaxID=2268457 RepID=UPI000E662FF5